MGWDEKSWDEVRRAHLIWGEMKCRVRSASVKCEVQGVKRVLWSVRKVFAWRWIAPGPCAGHVLGQHLCNSFAQSTHARAWLAHGACKFYRWKMSYSKSLRQLPPRLVRVLVVLFKILDMWQFGICWNRSLELTISPASTPCKLLGYF